MTKINNNKQRKINFKILTLKFVFIILFVALSIGGMTACSRIPWENHTVPVTFHLMLPANISTDVVAGETLVRTPVTIMFTEYTTFSGDHDLAGEGGAPNRVKTPLLFLHSTETSAFNEINIIQNFNTGRYNVAGYYRSVIRVVPNCECAHCTSNDNTIEPGVDCIMYVRDAEGHVIWAMHPVTHVVTDENGVQREQFLLDSNNRIVRERRRLVNESFDFPEFVVDNNGETIWRTHENGNYVYEDFEYYETDENGDYVYVDDEDGNPERVVQQGQRRVGYPNQIIGLNEQGRLEHLELKDRPHVYDGMQIFIKFEPDFVFEIGYNDEDGNFVELITIRAPVDGYFRPNQLTGTFMPDRSHPGVRNVSGSLNRVTIFERATYEDGRYMRDEDTNEFIYDANPRTLIMFRDGIGEEVVPPPREFDRNWRSDAQGLHHIPYISATGEALDLTANNNGTWIQHRRDRSLPDGEGFTHRIYTSYLEGEWTVVTNRPRLNDAVNNPGDGIVMLANLDFTGFAWPFPINATFEGSFIGGGNTIRNVTRTITGADIVTFPGRPDLPVANGGAFGIGLFGELTSTARMENISFENIIINFNSQNWSRSYIALLAGRIHQNTYFRNVSVGGEVRLMLNYPNQANLIFARAGGTVGDLRLGLVGAFSPGTPPGVRRPLIGVSFENARISRRLHWGDELQRDLRFMEGSFECYSVIQANYQTWSIERIDAIIPTLPPLATLSLANRALVESVRRDVSALNIAQQAMLGNLGILEAAEVRMAELILNDMATIGTLEQANVTEAHRLQVASARAFFRGLNSSQQALVPAPSLATLASAEAAVVHLVNGIIYALNLNPNLTNANIMANRTAVENVRAAVNALGTEAQALLNTERLAELDDAEVTIALFIISALPTNIIPAHAIAIETARAFVNNMSASGLARVTNIATLEAAEARLAELGA